jgi:hypothetical protein
MARPDPAPWPPSRHPHCPCADDDPRLQQPAQRRPPSGPPRGGPSPAHLAGGPGAPAAAAAGAARGLDFSQALFQSRPAASGAALPDLVIYGVEIPGMHVVALAGAGLFLGWRGLLLGAAYGERRWPPAPGLRLAVRSGSLHVLRAACGGQLAAAGAAVGCVCAGRFLVAGVVWPQLSCSAPRREPHLSWPLLSRANAVAWRAGVFEGLAGGGGGGGPQGGGPQGGGPQQGGGLAGAFGSGGVMGMGGDGPGAAGPGQRLAVGGGGDGGGAAGAGKAFAGKSYKLSRD